MRALLRSGANLDAQRFGAKLRLTKDAGRQAILLASGIETDAVGKMGTGRVL